MTQGRFIAFEGGEGAGKSTQARLLAEALKQSGKTVVLTREPGGTAGAEAIRELLLHPPGTGWGAQAEALLFAAARSDHVSNLIVPALEQGQWVISDRFVDSSRAYQGGAGGLGDDAITGLHRFGSNGLRPDLTLLIEVDEGLTKERLTQRDGGVNDAIGGRDHSYHRAVAQSFRSIAGSDPASFAIIDGNGSAEAVHEQVMQALAPLMDAQ